MTITLPNDLESPVRGEVLSGRYASEDLMVAEIVRQYFRQQELRHASHGALDPAPTLTVLPTERKPFWERVAELRESVPESEWDEVPSDGSQQLDHYLYGAPKRPAP